MSGRNLRSNSTPPPIFPIGRTVYENMTQSSTPTGSGNQPATNTVQAPTVTWTTNPFVQNFNPGTTSGNKIFVEKSKGPSDGVRIGDSVDQATKLLDFLKQKKSSFGTCVNRVPIEWDATGTPSNWASIIDQYQTIKEDVLTRAAHKRHSTPLALTDPIPPASKSNLWKQIDIDPANIDPDKATFYDRVNSSVVSECLLNTMTPLALANLDRDRAEFSFIDSEGAIAKDGPLMLHKLLRKVDPATSVSIENHRLAIENCKLQDFKNDVSLVIANINKHHTAIIDNNGSYAHDTLRRHALQTLRSGPNAEFNAFVDDINRDIESGIGQHANITVDKLFKATERFYNNLVSKNQWDKVNPKDASLIALTTQISELQKQIAAKNNSNGSNGGNNKGNTNDGGNGGDEEMFYGVQKWRTVNKGPSVTRDGVVWKWCPHHKHPRGHYSGLYYSNHDESTHAEWKQNKDANRGRKTAATTDKQPEDSSSKKLTIANELKTAFMSSLHVSEADIDKIIAGAQGN